MERITVAPDVLAQLRDTTYPAEILDDAGRRAAVVLPPDLFREMFDIYCDKVFGPTRPLTPADIATAVTSEELIAYGRALDAKLREKGAA